MIVPGLKWNLTLDQYWTNSDKQTANSQYQSLLDRYQSDIKAISLQYYFDNALVSKQYRFDITLISVRYWSNIALIATNSN